MEIEKWMRNFSQVQEVDFGLSTQHLTNPLLSELCSSNSEKSLVDPYKLTQQGPNVGMNPKEGTILQYRVNCLKARRNSPSSYFFIEKHGPFRLHLILVLEEMLGCKKI